MFFRNLTFVRFPPKTKLADLESALAETVLKPVGPLEMSTRGFVSPFGRDAEALHHRLGDSLWLTVGGEDRLLPAAVVNDEVAKKLAVLEQREGRKLGGRARKRLKEDVLHELLPRAFVKPMRLDGALDVKHGVVAIDTSSRKAAEAWVSELRRALGSFPALPLNPGVAPRSVLTGWIAGEPLPTGLSLGEECELKDSIDGGAIVRCQRQELQGEEIAKHLESGKQVTRLALALDDKLSFVLGEDLVVRKLKFLDGAVAELEADRIEDQRAELDARFALQSAELARLFALLDKAFELSKAEA
jgi:recombination associated protein RdgC